MTGGEEFTPLLERMRRGDPGGAEGVFARVYEELRSLARQRMAAERRGHTLEATALVHEVYLRLLGGRETPWQSRAHFYAAAAEAMRHVLIDHARTRKRLKRGGDRKRVPLDVADLAANHDPQMTLDIVEAIDRLQETDDETAAVVRLRFFTGLSVAETARALDLSERTVKRAWSYARAWLFEALE